MLGFKLNHVSKRGPRTSLGIVLTRFVSCIWALEWLIERFHFSKRNFVEIFNTLNIMAKKITWLFTLGQRYCHGQHWMYVCLSTGLSIHLSMLVTKSHDTDSSLVQSLWTWSLFIVGGVMTIFPPCGWLSNFVQYLASTPWMLYRPQYSMELSHIWYSDWLCHEPAWLWLGLSNCRVFCGFFDPVVWFSQGKVMYFIHV